MDEFKWIQMSSFVLLTLQFTAAEQHFTVRDGDQVSLPCDNRRDDLHRCDEVYWYFTDAGNRPTGWLVERGQISEQARTKSDRLSVTKNCSLVIKKVSAEDAGRYLCVQYKSGQQGQNSLVFLSVVTMTEREDADEVTLSCSVWTRGPCGHTVKWLFNRIDVDKENHQVKTSQSSCSASLTGPTSAFFNESRFNLLKCEVTDGDKVQFLFSPRPSGEKPGEDTTTTTTTIMKPRTTTTTSSSTTTTTTRKLKTTTTMLSLTTTTPENPIKTETISTSAITETPTGLNSTRTDRSVVDYMMLVLRVAELLLITLIAVLLIRAAGKQRPPDDNTVSHSVRRRTARRSGAAASQVHCEEDGRDSSVTYENTGDASASVHFHTNISSPEK